MRSKVKAGVLASLLVIVGSRVLYAEPIRIVREERVASARALVFNDQGFVGDSSGTQQVNADHLAAAAQARFGETTTRSEAETVSAIAANLRRFSGVGTASSSITGPAGDGSATAFFELWFELDLPQRYDFAAAFNAIGFGSWQSHLVRSPGDPGQSLLFSVISNTGPQLQTSRSGFLAPGRYAFSIRGDGSASTAFGGLDNGRGTFDFGFEMTPVPEPGSLLLLASAVLGVGARARRRAPPSGFGSRARSRTPQPRFGLLRRG
jgi:PEP-CTERM motif